MQDIPLTEIIVDPILMSSNEAAKSTLGTFHTVHFMDSYSGCNVWRPKHLPLNYAQALACVGFIFTLFVIFFSAIVLYSTEAF